MLTKAKNFRKWILGLATITLLLLVGGIAYALNLSWKSLVQSTEVELKSEASTASSLVRSSLVDASKILDVARLRLEEELKQGEVNPKQVYWILHSVVETFSIYNTSDPFGLLIFLNKEGQLIARSGEYPSSPLDFSERNYYRNLRDHPLAKFAIGKLRKAATTGKMVFHLSMPVHDGSGAIAGVVAVQIDELEMAITLREMLDGRESHIRVQDSGNETLFLIPMPESAPSGVDPVNGTLQRLAKASSVTPGALLIPGGTEGFPITVYMGFDRDPRFGFVSWSSVSESALWTIFLHQNRSLLLFALFAAAAIMTLFLRLFRQARRLEKSMEEANLDSMTLIGNRRGIEKEIERLWRDAARTGRPISVLFIDIDHFKDFNDLHGHAVGDRVLKTVARTLHEAIERPLDLCCRWGGEEFLAILPETTTGESLTVANRIRERIESMRLRVGGVMMQGITVSIGIASSQQDRAATAENLIHKADLAMLQAKAEGRNRTVLYRMKNSGAIPERWCLR